MLAKKAKVALTLSLLWLGLSVIFFAVYEIFTDPNAYDNDIRGMLAFFGFVFFITFIIFMVRYSMLKKMITSLSLQAEAAQVETEIDRLRLENELLKEKMITEAEYAIKHITCKWCKAKKDRKNIKCPACGGS